MTSRHLYAMRTFASREAMTAATEVLLAHADAVECGDHDGNVTKYRRGVRPEKGPDDYWWMTFIAAGRECAGRGEDHLVVHQPGTWDAALDAIPHDRDWWSWIQVIRETATGGRPDQTSKALEAELRHRWVPRRLMATLAPLNIDDVVVSVVDDVGSRPFSRTGGCLMVERALPPSTSAASLHQWWVDLFDALTVRYRLTTADVVPYYDEDEGFIRLAAADGSLPDDDALDAFVAAMDGEGAETDDWYEDGPAMLVPISGPDLPALLFAAAQHAEAMGMLVVEIHPEPAVEGPG